MNQQIKLNKVAKAANRVFYAGIIDADSRQYDGLVKEIERRKDDEKQVSGIIVCE